MTFQWFTIGLFSKYTKNVNIHNIMILIHHIKKLAHIKRFTHNILALIHHKENQAYKEISAHKEVYTQYNDFDTSHKENNAYKEISAYKEIYT